MKIYIKIYLLIALLMTLYNKGIAQSLEGSVIFNGKKVAAATIQFSGLTDTSLISDSEGKFRLKLRDTGNLKIRIEHGSFAIYDSVYQIHERVNKFNIELEHQSEFKSMVVRSGTMRPVTRLKSPVLVEVYNQKFFRRNPSPNIFEALQGINGIRPQVNCNVCNTGDIHINGLEGPYTLILIDGMPIVSSLSSVYGLFGIPNAIISRVEVVRGPSSSLYGTEAVGGLINIITKSPSNSPAFSFEIWSSSWGELNTDVAFKKAFKKATVLTGVNYFNYSVPMDKNKDGFTDIALQNRISIFQKWNFNRKHPDRTFSLAGRYLYEDRWGGEMQWNRSFRGGDSVYGESIYTSRAELIGEYQLPTNLPLKLYFSFNRHHQNSFYGVTSFQAIQSIGFAQLLWQKDVEKHAFLAGLTLRSTYYDDNTVATQLADSASANNKALINHLPGLFFQDEMELNKRQTLLYGLRYDYHQVHGSIFSPRVAYLKTFGIANSLRVNLGKGFRVVNLFTEDHAALTGARSIVIKNELKPESSYNASISVMIKHGTKRNNYLTFETTLFYTYFNNRILADYSDPNKIQYDNLNGHSISRGSNINMDAFLKNGWSFSLGITLMDVYSIDDGKKIRPYLTENFSSTWSVSKKIRKSIVFDYTGNLYSPMKLPTLGTLDPRDQESPWWSIQNLQMSYNKSEKLRFFGGIKNILNWTPWKNNAFIIARSYDPFDKKVQYDANGQVIATNDNPYALTFDPSYVYAPNQGRRLFLGLSYSF